MNFIRKLHKWLGLIIGIQFALWAVSGTMFSWLNHREVMPDHSTHAPAPATVSAATDALSEPASWLHEYSGTDVYGIRLLSLLDRWFWRVETSEGVHLRDAHSGLRSSIDEELARRMAETRYRGPGKLDSVTFHEAGSLEARKAGAAWGVAFDDPDETTLYFAADDGRLVATRNATWRVFDFFWMLHTMDYKGRDNFNHPVIITFATGALWLALSGIVLLTRSFRRRDFDFLRRA